MLGGGALEGGEAAGEVAQGSALGERQPEAPTRGDGLEGAGACQERSGPWLHLGRESEGEARPE